MAKTNAQYQAEWRTRRQRELAELREKAGDERGLEVLQLIADLEEEGKKNVATMSPNVAHLVRHLRLMFDPKYVEPVVQQELGDLHETKNISGTRRELERHNAKPPRHPILRGTRHRRPQRELERAVAALDGLRMALEQLLFDQLDPTKTPAFAADLKNNANAIIRVAKRLTTPHSSSSAP